MHLTQRVFYVFIAITMVVCLASSSLLKPAPYIDLVRVASVLLALMCLMLLLSRPCPEWKHPRLVTGLGLVGIYVHFIILSLCAAVSLWQIRQYQYSERALCCVKFMVGMTGEHFTMAQQLPTSTGEREKVADCIRSIYGWQSVEYRSFVTENLRSM